MDRHEVLCYGDSNTWGCIPRWEESELPSERYDPDVRWPCVAESLLGPGYHLIEEGLGGRTTIYDRPDAHWLNGLPYLKPCLLTHRPLDLVILSLGTNDLLTWVQPEFADLDKGIRTLVDVVQSTPQCGRKGEPPQILLLSPTHIKPALGRTGVYGKFRGDVGRAKNEALSKLYRQVAAEKGCGFLDLAQLTEPSDADGVHLTREAHLILAPAIAKAISQSLRP